MTLTPMFSLFTHYALKESLRDLSGYADLRAAIRAYVDAVLPQLTEAEAQRDGLVMLVHRALAREQVKRVAWGLAALLLAEGDDAAFDRITADGFPAVRVAALAMREASEEATAAAVAAISALEDATVAAMPTLNAEAC